MNIKPIETVYNGYRFRSRLEARWAVFFDAAGIEYQYEPEGFEANPYGEEIFRYLPDFYLPGFECYVEVKPSREKLYEEEEKLSAMIDYNATPIANGLLVLGQIPPPQVFSPRFAYFQWERGIDSHQAIIVPQHYYDGQFNFAELWIDERVEDSNGVPKLPDVFVNEDLYEEYGSLKMYDRKNRAYYLDKRIQETITERTNECLCAARQARFEHGEKPNVRSVAV